MEGPGGANVGRVTWQADGYRAEELIGVGRTGEVWRGREIATGEAVALKRVAADRHPAQDAELRREAADDLRREAAVLSALSHPNLLRIRGAVSDADGLVLVLDHAAGGSVAELLARRGALPAGEVVTLLAPIADALAAAHSAGLVHGDVSAANVLLTGEGWPLLADLGTAALLAEEPRPALGTPGYLDPAVVAGRPATPASDVYALAALAAYALTGRAVGTDPAAAVAGLSGTHPLGSILRSSLQADPEHRPSARSLAGRMWAAAPALPLGLAAGDPARDASPPALTHAAHPRIAAPAPGTGVSAGRHRTPATRPAAGRRRALTQTVVGVLVLVVAGGAGLAWGSSSATPAGAIGARPPTSWPQVWSSLDQRRELAFATADATLLGQVYLPECPALAADLQVLRALAGRHARATGVRHEHAQVRVEAATAATATLLVVDQLQSYEVRDVVGRLIARRPPQRERRLRVRLARTTNGWRIAALSRG